MRVLVTGGAGFIGSSIAEYYVHRGHTVAVADKFTYAGKARNLADSLSQLELLIGSLSTGDLATRCAEWHPDVVIHCAADTHIDRSIADPFRFQINNPNATCSLLQALWTSGHTPTKIVVYSTDEVYGPTPSGMAYKETQPFHPSNAYSASKVGVEGLATAFYVTHGMPITVVRPCNTYGLRQHPEKVIPKFVRQLMRGEKLTLYNDGTGSRDWLHTADHARAIDTIVHSGHPGEAYNLAAHEEHSDAEIAELVQSTLEKPGSIVYTPGRPGHDRRYFMDGSKLRALGWEPQENFQSRIRETILWNAANQDYWDSDTVRLSGDVTVTTSTSIWRTQPN